MSIRDESEELQRLLPKFRSGKKQKKQGQIQITKLRVI